LCVCLRGGVGGLVGGWVLGAGRGQHRCVGGTGTGGFRARYGVVFAEAIV
jgi:hypothetical protein